MSEKNKRLLIGTLFISAVIILYFIFSKKSDNEALSTVTVAQGDIIEKVTAVGNIMPQQTVTVKSPISGKVSQLFHDEGDRVEKNAPLLEIQPDPTPKDYITAKQTLEIDRAKEQQYAADVARFKQLLKEGAISSNDQDYNQAISEYQQSHQQRIQDEENLALLEKGEATIGNRTIANIITSPISGNILQRNINLGDTVVPQTDYQAGNALFTIADMHTLIFKGQISEIDVAKLHPNMLATLKIAALPNVILQGRLSKIALQSAAAAKTDSNNANQNIDVSSSSSSDSTSPFAVGYKVEINQLTPFNITTLRSGYSATADIVVGQVDKAITIPIRVMQFENEKPYVFVLDKNNKQIKRFIKTGLSDGMRIQIISGLTLGEKVIETSPPADNTTSGSD